VINWWRWWIAFLFYVEQNSYFGWNAMPKSDAELIADGITLLLTALAFKDHR
jgi:hypothetical protein